jgi:D-sedoheptulose 7-phosphate isomerase
MEELSRQARENVERAASMIVSSLQADGTLFLAGNGGSCADAMHMAGELAKNFEQSRPLSAALQARITEFAGTADIAESLQQGVRVMVLGMNPVLATAVDNDLRVRHIGFAQELCAVGRPGDCLLAISTSGRSESVLYAAYVARALDMSVIVLGSESPNPLAELADVAVGAAGTTTAEIQGHHVVLYHELCRVMEQRLFT